MIRSLFSKIPTADGKADKQTIFADRLHLPIGFEIAAEGVYVSQGTNFMLFTDTDGDDKADKKEILLSGFDDHDTHHAHHAYTSDPSGAIYMGEGVFLHTNVETPMDRCALQMEVFIGTVHSVINWNVPHNFRFPIPGALLSTNGVRIFLQKHPVRMFSG